MLSVADITIADFQSQFARDFKFGAVIATDVVDNDITSAFVKAKCNFNPSLFTDGDDILKAAFLLLSAHYLCTDLQAASQGRNSVGSFPVVSRTVGSVNETYNVPLWLQHDKVLSLFATTRYGVEYASMISPRLVGNVQVMRGATTS